MSTPVIHIAEPGHDLSLFSLGEISERCGVHADIVVEMVEYGIVTPADVRADSEGWRFDTDALLRVIRAARLRRDLELDPAGLALALELLDEIDALQQRVRTLQQRLHQLQGDAGP